MSNHVSNYPNINKIKITPEKLCDQIGAMEHLRELDKIDTTDCEAIENRIRYFFDFCAEYALRPGVELLSAALGVNRSTLWEWQKKGGMRGRLIDSAKQLISALLEQWSMDGSVNPTTAIWMQKNHFGYKDVVAVETEARANLEALPTKQDIIERLPQDDMDAITAKIDDSEDVN